MREITRKMPHACCVNTAAHTWKFLTNTFILLLIISIVSTVFARMAHAQVGSERYSSIVIDAQTGHTLSAVNADEARHPASLTKMMTLYLAFEALRDHRISLDSNVPISTHAASMSPTKLGLVPGTKFSVEQAILALVTKSANDAAAALGELLGRDEVTFAQMMTLRARALGMSNTVFRNASGLPDSEQISTAHDMATLGRRLIIDFPNEYHYFSTPNFRFHGKLIENHDHMLQTYPGADGMKTGYVTASGFNLVTSALRSDVRLIGVVLGANGPGERDAQMTSLLDRGFEMMNVAPVTMARRENNRANLISTANAALPLPPMPPKASMSAWAVQLGSYSNEAAAKRAAIDARHWVDVGQTRIEPVTSQGRTTYHALLAGLNASEASGSCSTLSKHKVSCSVQRPD